MNHQRNLHPRRDGPVAGRSESLDPLSWQLRPPFAFEHRNRVRRKKEEEEEEREEEEKRAERAAAATVKLIQP